MTRRQIAVRNAIKRIKNAVPNPSRLDKTDHTIVLTGAEIYLILPLLEEFISEPIDLEILAEHGEADVSCVAR